MGVLVGIDKFMSECRALTNFTGNAVATLLIGRWTNEIDNSRACEVLVGRLPFDEQSLEPAAMVAHASGGPAEKLSAHEEAAPAR